MITRIVTHPGSAHVDDFLSVCAGVFLNALVMAVSRREPTDRDCNDPACLVLDAGELYEPELNNFDHHQRGRDETPECALSLYARHVDVPCDDGKDTVTLHRALSVTSWFDTAVLMDVAGPFAVAKSFGTEPETVQALQSPLAGALLHDFGCQSEIRVYHPMMLQLFEVGKSVVESAVGLYDRQSELDEVAEIVKVGGVPGMVLRSADKRGTGVWRERRHPELAFSISHDDRGPGWSLYRYADDPRIDFSRIAADSRVLFVHKSGHLAKTHERLSLGELNGLVRKSLT